MIRLLTAKYPIEEAKLKLIIKNFFLSRASARFKRDISAHGEGNLGIGNTAESLHKRRFGASRREPPPNCCPTPNGRNLRKTKFRGATKKTSANTVRRTTEVTSANGIPGARRENLPKLPNGLRRRKPPGVDYLKTNGSRFSAHRTFLKGNVVPLQFKRTPFVRSEDQFFEFLQKCSILIMGRNSNLVCILP